MSRSMLGKYNLDFSQILQRQKACFVTDSGVKQHLVSYSNSAEWRTQLQATAPAFCPQKNILNLTLQGK